jgi:hypothetical protein
VSLPKIIIYKGSFHSYLSKLWAKSYGAFSLEISNCPSILTPKVLEAIFQAFLKFGHAIVDAMFVQNISNFSWTCGLVLALGHTNFYKIPIFGLGVMPQKQNSFVLGTS